MVPELEVEQERNLVAEDDDYEMYGDDIYLIAVARYNSKGNVIDIELVDIDFDFAGCKWKEENKNG